MYDCVVDVDPYGLYVSFDESADAKQSNKSKKGNYYSEQELKNGTFIVNMQTLSGKLPDTGQLDNGVTGTIEFVPNTSCDECKEIKLVQTVRFEYWKDGNYIPYKWSDKMEPLNGWRTQKDDAKKIDRNYHIDVRGDCDKSIFYRDCTSNPAHSHNGATVKGNPFRSASLHDTPRWPGSTQFFMRFETCAVCADDLSTIRSFGCVHWGFNVDKKGKTSGFETVGAERMSPTMIDAIRRYNAWEKQ